MKGKLIACTLLLGLTSLSASQAQERDESSMNVLSARPIESHDVMMKRTLWRRVDLKEKQNLPMFSKNNEITRYLIEAAKAGLLEAYVNDSCTTKLTPEQLRKKLIVPNQAAGLSAEEIAAGFGGAGTDNWGAAPAPAKSAAAQDDGGWGAPAAKKAEPEDDGWGPPTKKTTPKKGAAAAKKEAPKPVVEEPKPVETFSQPAVAVVEEEYFPNQLSVIEVKEDWVFDKKRSRNYMDIQAITIYLPADQNAATGLELPVASFRYKDLDKLFRSDPKKYIWYNTHNISQHKNLADAFDLRLFYGRVTKYSHPEDKSFIDIYKGEKAGLLKSLEYEHELLELEHSLWEY